MFALIYALNKKEGVYLFASFLLILSGILIVFILREGTKIQGNGWGGFELYEVFANPRIGAGTIMWCVLCILGGAFGVFDHYMKCRRTHSQKK